MEPEFGPAQPGMSEPAKRGPAAGPRHGPGGGHHRRSLSDTSFRLPDDDDDILFDDIDFSDVDFRALAVSDPPPPPPPADSATAAPPAPAPARFPPRGAHLRSLSVDAAFFEGLDFSVPATPPEGSSGEREKAAAGHRRSGSVDGVLEADLASVLDFTKKAMPADKLAELALIDPKRAKRILANRQSAARSKERKIRYTGELERKVQTLQTEATTLSAQLTRLQRDTNDLTAENKELKLRFQAMEQQARLRDALNDTLRDEVQRLRIATGQIAAFNDSFNKGLQPSAFFPSLHARHQLGNQQHHISQTSPNGQSLSGQSSSGSMAFTRSPNNVS